MGTQVQDPAAWASWKRKHDELFGVWSSSERTFVHPEFQFGGKATWAQLKELLHTLRTCVGLDSIFQDKGGWPREYWLYQPHPQLSEQSSAMPTVDVHDLAAEVEMLSALSDAPRTR